MCNEGDGNRENIDGCEVISSCLECPLEQCLHEIPRGMQRYLRERRDARIAGLRRAGKSTGEIACYLGVSQRTVQRALAREKSGRRSP